MCVCVCVGFFSFTLSSSSRFKALNRSIANLKLRSIVHNPTTRNPKLINHVILHLKTENLK